MTDAQKLKRHPVTILRKAMVHLRKTYESSRSSSGREAIRLIKVAIADVFQADLDEIIKKWREQ